MLLGKKLLGSLDRLFCQADISIVCKRALQNRLRPVWEKPGNVVYQQMRVLCLQHLLELIVHNLS